MLRKLVLTTAVATAGMVTLHPAVAVDHVPEASSLSYTIERKGREIGRHIVSYTITPNGQRDVEIATRIRVKFAFMTVFRMDHAGHELWDHDRLVRMFTATMKNSRKEEVDLRAVGDHVIVATDKGTETAPLDVVPSSFTKPDFWIDSGEKDFLLLDTLSGRLRPSKLVYKGRMTIELDGQAYDTRCYRIFATAEGRLSHEFWIDDAGYLIKAHLITRDGESLYYTFAGSERAA
ncbi:MAG: DUF6134 family protein [Rhodothalassiaceae bacterium]